MVVEDGCSSALSVVFGSSSVDSTSSRDEIVGDGGSVPADVDAKLLSSVGVAMEIVVGVWPLSSVGVAMETVVGVVCSANDKSRAHYSHRSVVSRSY